MLKMRAGDTAMRIATDAAPPHGGCGAIKEYRVERPMRDAKIRQIWEGGPPALYRAGAYRAVGGANRKNAARAALHCKVRIPLSLVHLSLNRRDAE